METSTDPARPRASRAVLVGAALALVAGAACSSGDDDGERALTESIDSSQSESESQSDSESDGGDDQTGGGQAGSGSASGEALGTTRAELTANATDDSTIPVRIDLTRLERNGELVELTLVLTNEAEASSDGSEAPAFGPGSMFGDPPTGIDRRYDTSGIGLVDGEEQMLYLPAFDSEGNCLCTFMYSDGSIPPGEPFTVEATYGGVPEDVEDVDVRIPDFPTISGVAIR